MWKRLFRVEMRLVVAKSAERQPFSASRREMTQPAPQALESGWLLPARGVDEADAHHQVVLAEVVEDRHIAEVVAEDVVGADPQQAEQEAAQHPHDDAAT